MKNVFLLLFVVVGLLQAQISIVTGGKGGTYYPFGEQISKICGNEIGGLNVISTKGSLDNIKRLLVQPDVKFAIVQYDVLLYMKEKSKYNPKMKRAINNLRVVMPFYDEQIHIVVKNGLNLKNINELNGLRVSIGSKGSGTYITAKNIMKYGNLKFQQFYLSLKDSLKAIKRGDIDAFFYVAGVPAKIFNVNNYSHNKLFKFYKKNIDLIEMKDYNLNNFYPLQTISQHDYKWLSHPVETGAVKSVLITYNYKPNQPSYQRVKNLYKCIYSNINLLQSDPIFHKKWKEVSPTNFSSIKWKIHPAVREYLNNLNSGSIIKNKDEIDEFFDNL